MLKEILDTRLMVKREMKACQGEGKGAGTGEGTAFTYTRFLRVYVTTLAFFYLSKYGMWLYKS
jgi:hypothetical protein